MKQSAEKHAASEAVNAAQIADILALETEMFRRLSRSGCLSLAETGELVEDIAKLYLQIAGEIRSKVLTPASAA